jgi:hypothetical protein
VVLIRKTTLTAPTKRGQAVAKKNFYRRIKIPDKLALMGQGFIVLAPSALFAVYIND